MNNRIGKRGLHGVHHGMCVIGVGSHTLHLPSVMVEKGDRHCPT